MYFDNNLSYGDNFQLKKNILNRRLGKDVYNKNNRKL